MGSKYRTPLQFVQGVRYNLSVMPKFRVNVHLVGWILLILLFLACGWEIQRRIDRPFLAERTMMLWETPEDSP